MTHLFRTLILILIAGYFTALATAQCAEPVFVTGKAYSTANWPMAVAKADVNGDGRPDIVTANFDGNGGDNNSLSTFPMKPEGGLMDVGGSDLLETLQRVCRDGNPILRP